MRNNKETVEEDIPTRDVDYEDRLSTQSSLGILSDDKMETDFLSSNQNESNNEMINEKLRIQRSLAKQTMDRANVASIPSYLLKPSVETPGRNKTEQIVVEKDSTLNASDLEVSLEKQIKFHENEITARSSSISPKAFSSEFTRKCQSIYNKIRESDASLTSLCRRSETMGLSTDPLKNLPMPDFSAVLDEFTPAESAEDRLLADEIEWRKENESIPLESKEQLNLSCFSGYIGKGEISLGSKSGEKVSIDEFFSRKTENIDHLDLKKSPDKEENPIALISMDSSNSSSTLKTNFVQSSTEEKENKAPKKSILSTSEIAEVLPEVNLDDTNSQLIDRLMQKCTAKYKKRSTEKSIENEILKKAPEKNLLKETTRNTQDIWTDAKHNDSSLPLGSPSICCTELEFSESDSAEELSEEWVKITSETVYCNQNIPGEITLYLTSTTNKWLLYKAKVNKSEGIECRCPSEENLLKYGTLDSFFIKYTIKSTKPMLLLEIELTDMVTRSKKSVFHKVAFQTEAPSLTVNTNSVDFGTVPEKCIRKEYITVKNESQIVLTVALKIKQKYENTFSLAEKQVRLDPEEEKQLKISLYTPPINKLEGAGPLREVRGQLILSAVACPTREIQLISRVGLTKVQFRSNCVPLTIQAGQTRGLSLKNSGAIALELDISIDGADMNFFRTVQNQLILQPNETSTIDVTFSGRLGQVAHAVLRLQNPGGQSFTCPIEGVSCSSPASSNRSGSTSASLQDGRLPLECTNSELVWECVKPGKSILQEVVIRNRSSHRLKLQVSVSGTGFRLVRDRNEYGAGITMTLLGHESRALSVSFSPITIGAACGKLIFSPPDTTGTERTSEKPVRRQTIQLYGYCGHVNLTVQGAARDTAGRTWLPLGLMGTKLIRSLTLRNSGSLPMFAGLNVMPAPWLPSRAVQVHPCHGIVPPSSTLEVTISCNLPRHSSTTGDVIEVASLRLISGAEPTRARIRHLLKRSPTLTLDDKLRRLLDNIPEEQTPSDVASCRERTEMNKLLHGLSSKDIVLTVERNFDQTTTGDISEDTCAFQSLYEDETTLFDSEHRKTEGLCAVEPQKLLLTPPVKMKDNFLLISHHLRPMPFEVSLPTDSPLSASPVVGIVPPNQTALITLSCSNLPSMSNSFLTKVRIFVENQMMEIEVKLIRVSIPRQD